MQTLTKKLKLIYLPFLIMAVLFVIIYTSLNWLLIIKANMFSIKEDMINYWIPIVLSWIPILIWLRPRIKLLKLTSDRGDKPFFYMLIASIAIAAPTIVAQSYIEKATGRLTPLETINEINKFESTKYYSLKKYYIDTSNVGVHPAFDVSGKNNETFNMHLYFVLPILSSESDTNKSNCMAWMGVSYSDHIDNSDDENEKEEKYKVFANKSLEEFKNKDFNQFIYLDRIGNTDEAEGYNEAIKTVQKYSSNQSIVFQAVNEAFEDRYNSSSFWIFGAFVITGGIWLIMLLFPDFDEDKLQKFESGNIVSDSEFKDMLNLMKPTDSFFITPILIQLNVLVFLIMVLAGLGFINFKGEDLFNWGANFKPATTDGEWWRLLTSMFLHGGLMHIVANMYGLFFIGIFLEPILGRKKYLTSYLMSGIVASCASICWNDATISVGASGAIFGLYGLFLVLLIMKLFPIDFSKSFLTSTSIFIGFNLLMGFASNGIDNAAHLGGMFCGMLFGFILYPALKNQLNNDSTGMI